MPAACIWCHFVQNKPWACRQQCINKSAVLCSYAWRLAEKMCPMDSTIYTTLLPTDKPKRHQHARSCKPSPFEAYTPTASGKQQLWLTATLKPHTTSSTACSINTTLCKTTNRSASTHYCYKIHTSGPWRKKDQLGGNDNSSLYPPTNEQAGLHIPALVLQASVNSSTLMQRTPQPLNAHAATVCNSRLLRAHQRSLPFTVPTTTPFRPCRPQPGALLQ
jgi:hypothetical protein